MAGVVLAGLAGRALRGHRPESGTNTLDACVAAVKANDSTDWLDCISPTAPQVRADARSVLERFDFSKEQYVMFMLTLLIHYVLLDRKRHKYRGRFNARRTILFHCRVRFFQQATVRPHHGHKFCDVRLVPLHQRRFLPGR